MAGPRLPTDVVVARGKKHLSRAEEAERRGRELKLAKPKTAKPPKWLAEEQKKDFRALGKRLIAAGIYSDLDADSLGRYLTAQRQWELATEMAQAALEAGDQEDADAWSRVQDRYFKQARACAGDLGLTVTSRCRLVVPEADEPAVDNAFLRLIQGGRAADG